MGNNSKKIQVSYHVINLYPSILIDKAINTRAKLTITDIHKSSELCLSKLYCFMKTNLDY